MCGGGGGTNTVTSQQEFRPPSWLTDANGHNLWSEYVQNVIGNSQQGYQPNPNPQTAPLNNVQLAGLNQVVDVAQNGTPTSNAAQAQVMHTLNGDYSGPGTQANFTPGTNPYAGPNAYLDNMINSNADLMSRQYAQGAGATLNAMAARDGAFGSSAHQQMASQGAAGLANSIGQMANNARMQDYGMQQQLSENAINRNLGAQQWNNNAQQQAYQFDRGNQMAAAGLGSGQMYQNDLNAGRAVTGVGDALHAYSQANLDDMNNAWNQRQQYPWQMLQNIGGALSQASGVAGSSNFTQQGNNGGMGWLSGLLGGGALGLAGLNYLNF